MQQQHFPFRFTQRHFIIYQTKYYMNSRNMSGRTRNQEKADFVDFFFSLTISHLLPVTVVSVTHHKGTTSHNLLLLLC